MIEKPRIRLLPHAYMERLKKAPVITGHERCASSSFCDSGTVIICALHGYGLARQVLVGGRYFNACRDCIEAHCQVLEARTEDHARGLYVDMSE